MIKLGKKTLILGSLVLASLLVGCGEPTVESVIALIEKGDFNKANSEFLKLSNTADASEVGTQIGAIFVNKVTEFASTPQTQESRNQLIDELSQYKALSGFNEVVDNTIEILNEVYDINSMYQIAETAQNNEEYLDAIDYYSIFINMYEKSDLTCLNSELLDSAKLNIEEVAPKLKESSDYTLPVQIVGSVISKNSIGTQELGVQFKNISDKAIKKIVFSVLGFKEDGTAEKLNFGNSTMMNCNYDNTIAPNQISDAMSRWSLYPENDKLAHTIITIDSVEFYEGEAWTNPLYIYEISKYENTTLSQEDISKLKTEQAELMEEVISQSEPSPLEISSSSLRKNSIGRQEVNVQFKNVSNKAIKQLTFSVLGYDKNGYPVKLGFGNDEYINCQYNNTIQPNETTSSNYTWSLYPSAEVAKVKVILNDVEFYEADTWRNIAYNTVLNNSIGKVYSE